MCQKCIGGVGLDEASHIVMSNNENQTVVMLTNKHGLDKQMALFREENKDDGDVIITLCACEDGANGLTATIKETFDQLN